jgi:hypothetical protein
MSVSRGAGHLHVSGFFVTIEWSKLMRQGLLTRLERLAPLRAQVKDVLFAFLNT